MKLSELYRRALEVAIEHDPRPRSQIFKGKPKRRPYADSLILHGDPAMKVEDILVGIDIDTSELLLAERIRQANGLDLVISHHPSGRGLLELFKVMQVQAELLSRVGVKQAVALGLLEERMAEVSRKLLSTNHMRAIDVARLLDIPFICLHTAADNLAYDYVNKLMRTRRPGNLKDILDLLGQIPEYRLAKKETCGPRILSGASKRPAGRIFVEMTGGTEGPKGAIEKLYQAGVRTLICMHLSEEHFKKVKDLNLNVIIAGHISSDNLGLNLLLDKIDRERKLNIISCSGFRRVARETR